VPAPVSELSLRERGKARRRDAIERAALRLFAERGYEATTVADIAAAAEVSPRTVSLYFPSKADLALGRGNEAAERLTAALARRGPDESVLDVFGRWLADELATADPEFTALGAAVFEANPTLRALRTVQIDRAMEVGTRAFAEDLGLPPDSAVVRIVRGAAVGAMYEYPGALADGSDPQEVLDAVLGFLRGGVAAVSRRVAPAAGATPPGP
jgi:AcrR family transcriptional regulator